MKVWLLELLSVSMSTDYNVNLYLFSSFYSKAVFSHSLFFNPFNAKEDMKENEKKLEIGNFQAFGS